MSTTAPDSDTATQTGPYATRPGFARIFEAMSGFAHLTGEAGGRPQHMNYPLGDMVAGLFGAFAIAVALAERRAHPAVPGSEIDLSLAHVQAGTAIPLAIAMPERSGIAPRVSTFKELGYPMQAYSWWGLLAPAGTPPAIVERLNQAVRQALQTDGLHERLLAQGMEPVGSSPAEFAQHIRAETDKWRHVVEAAQIQTP